MSKYAHQPLDLSGLRTIPIQARGGKVRIADFAKPYVPSHDRDGSDPANSPTMTMARP